MHSTRVLPVLTMVLALVTLFGACDRPAARTAKPTVITLDPSLPWHGRNRQRLNRFIRTWGRGGPRYDSARPPVAVFDWDNTVVKNDIGNAVVYWLVRTNKILQPPGGDWGRTSRYMTPEGKAALARACAGTAPGRPLPTSTNYRCADEILSMYRKSRTVEGKLGFAGHDHRWMQPAYAWGIQLEAGYTLDQIRAFSRIVMRQMLAARRGATQSAGSWKGLPGYVRFYPQIRDLIESLRRAGFEVWVMTASPEHVVEPMAAGLGFRRSRVSGARPVLDRRGVITYDLEGCGPYRDGDNTITTYNQGKRCWINKDIFGDKTPSALKRNPDPKKRPALAAGDATTDLGFLVDATGVKLVINRHKDALMCHAYHNREGNWLINPMFIDPLPRRPGRYPCASTACFDRRGKPAPCRDLTGRVVPDQLDTVY